MEPAHRNFAFIELNLRPVGPEVIKLFTCSKSKEIHHHTMQTNPPHLEEESQNSYSNKTSVDNKSKQPPIQDDCKIRKDTKICTTKQRQTQNPHNQCEAHQARQMLMHEKTCGPYTQLS